MNRYRRGRVLIYDVDSKEVLVKPFNVIVAFDQSHACLKAEEFPTERLHSNPKKLTDVRKVWVYQDRALDPKVLRILMPSEHGQKTHTEVFLKDYGCPELTNVFNLQVLFAASKEKNPGFIK